MGCKTAVKKVKKTHIPLGLIIQYTQSKHSQLPDRLPAALFGGIVEHRRLTFFGKKKKRPFPFINLSTRLLFAPGRKEEPAGVAASLNDHTLSSTSTPPKLWVSSISEPASPDTFFWGGWRGEG